jgi:hypothetical protein
LPRTRGVCSRKIEQLVAASTDPGRYRSPALRMRRATTEVILHKMT